MLTKKSLCFCNACDGLHVVEIKRACKDCGLVRAWPWAIPDLLEFVGSGWMSSCGSCGAYWRCYVRDCTIADMDRVMLYAAHVGLDQDLIKHLAGKEVTQ